MFILDNDRILVGIKLNHLLLLIPLALILFLSMTVYRESYYGFSDVKREGNCWVSEWSGAWHPWAEIETRKAFLKEGAHTWRWADTGQAFQGFELNAQLQRINDSRIAEEFKSKSKE